MQVFATSLLGKLMRLFSHEVWYIQDKKRRGASLARWERDILDRHERGKAKMRRGRGLKLQAFRSWVGLSQSALAKMLGVSRRSICYYESGHHSPRDVARLKLLYLGFCWRTGKRSLSRRDAVARIGELRLGVPVSDVVRFYCWWQAERGYSVSDWRFENLSKKLDAGGGMTFC